MANMLVDMPEDGPIPIDDVTQFDYMSNIGVSVLGIPYYTFDGMLQYDTGIYSRPDTLDSLNPKLYWNIIKNIDLQQARYSFKINHGHTPTDEELQEAIQSIKSHIPNKTTSILDYLEGKSS